MSFKKWQKLIAAKTPNAVALDLLMEEARFAGLRPVWLDTVGSLAGEAALAVEGQFVDPVEPAIHQQKLGCIDFVQADRERIASQRACQGQMVRVRDGVSQHALIALIRGLG